MAESKTEVKSGIQQQVEAGVQEANKSLLQSIKDLLGISPKETSAPAATAPDPKADELTKLKAALEASEKAHTELKTKTEELVKKHEASLTTKQEETKSQANVQARNILAQAGHEAVSAEKADDKGGSSKSAKDLWAEYQTIPTSTEKRAFYLKHKELMG
jgi:hypothetical protein